MNKQTGIVALVGLVSGALGSLAIAFLGTPAAARDLSAVGKPSIVQIAVAPLAPENSSFSSPATGVIFRLWSDGAVDAVGYYTGPDSGQWGGLCSPQGQGPPFMCVQSFGVIPENPALPADLNNDGKVDGADLGSLLGAWSGKPRAE